MMEKPDYSAQQGTLSQMDSVDAQGTQSQEGTQLHRGLKARHITMIAIGGAIGQ
jgi:amino acid permease